MLVVLVLGIVGFFFKTIMELVKYMACMSCLKYEGIPVSETKNEEDSSITYEIAVDRGEKTSTFKYRLEKDEQPFTLNEPIPVRIDSRKPLKLTTENDIKKLKKSILNSALCFAASLILFIVILNFL